MTPWLARARLALAYGTVGTIAAFGCLVAWLLVVGSPAPATVAEPPGRFELVGSSPLENRGMNAALAVHGDYAYVGSRTDGTHPDSGILVVDVSDPADPEVVSRIGRPHAAIPGETTRELRVWPDQDLLMVLSFECNEAGHMCPASAVVDVEPAVRFFDISGELAREPRLISTYQVPDNPHEFFLWDDPRHDGRALLYITTAYVGSGATIDTEGTHLLVTDITGARQGRFRELARWSPEREAEWDEAGVHSLSVSRNGRRAFLADLEGGFLMADTSELALGTREPEIRQITPAENAVHHEVPGAHSALPLPGRPFALITDEVYGEAFGLGPAIGFNPLQGCPWGWARLIRVSEPARPRIVGEFRVPPWNSEKRCDQIPVNEREAASFSSHNPTVTPHLAIVSWHSAGLWAIGLRDPSHPQALAGWSPKALPVVLTEDPALSAGGTVRTIVWSYPIVQDGLIYVVDIRNGLFVLRYRGPHARELRCRTFIEGNSNLGERSRSCRRIPSGASDVIRTIRATKPGGANRAHRDSLARGTERHSGGGI